MDDFWPQMYVCWPLAEVNPINLITTNRGNKESVAFVVECWATKGFLTVKLWNNNIAELEVF